MDFKEITTKLENLSIVPEDFYPSDDLQVVFGQIKHRSEGDTGGEDEGSNYRRVYEFVDHGVFLAVTGYYTSFDGTDMDDKYTEVKPVDKTVTLFEKVVE